MVLTTFLEGATPVMLKLRQTVFKYLARAAHCEDASGTDGIASQQSAFMEHEQW